VTISPARATPSRLRRTKVFSIFWSPVRNFVAYFLLYE
jgi:hypothetical protein